MNRLVIKVGGNQIDDPVFIDDLASAISKMDLPPILVHGGGKEIGAVQKALGGEPVFINGLRVTDQIALSAAEMVLCGTVNTRLVAALLSKGVDAQGVSGVDRGFIRVEKVEHPGGDLGYVGHPVSVRIEVIEDLLSQNVVPVIAPISLGTDGIYNVNADDAASAIAAAYRDADLVFISNVPGVKVNERILSTLHASQVHGLIESEVIHSGMIPKVQAALSVFDKGVSSVRITDLAGLNQGYGTTIVASGYAEAMQIVV